MATDASMATGLCGYISRCLYSKFDICATPITVCRVMVTKSPTWGDGGTCLTADCLSIRDIWRIVWPRVVGAVG